MFYTVFEYYIVLVKLQTPSLSLGFQARDVVVIAIKIVLLYTVTHPEVGNSPPLNYNKPSSKSLTVEFTQVVLSNMAARKLVSACTRFPTTCSDYITSVTVRGPTWQISPSKPCHTQRHSLKIIISCLFRGV